MMPNERMIQIAKQSLYLLEDRYNPENDLVPEAPRVTHTDKVLLDAIHSLMQRTENLEVEVRSLKLKVERGGR